MQSQAYMREVPGASPTEPRGQRIALFMFDFARTGVVLNAVRLANALAARGRRVWLLVCREDGREQHAIDPAVTVVVVPQPTMLRRLRRSSALLASVPALRRRLRQLAPDMLLSAGNHGHFAALLAVMGIPRLRLVLRISNELDHSNTSRLSRRLRHGLHRRLIARADRLLLVSAHLARHPLVADALESGKAVVTPNGVDVERVRRLGAEACPHPWLEDGIPVVVAVGRLARHKNFDTLVQAVARAAQQRPLRLIILGGGSTEEKQRLQQLARGLGIGDDVHLQGEVANPFAFIARANVFALPSLWEGASNVLLEALACDVPIVAARSAGNAQEVLGYGRFGLLVDPQDIDGMAQAILYQASPGGCRPGTRVADFAAGLALARACAALTDTGANPNALPRDPSPGHT
jgi:glycosyltransferase involved in cell wall biosynthesis